MHAVLTSRSNVANSICIWSKKPQLQKYCKLSLVYTKWHNEKYTICELCT